MEEVKKEQEPNTEDSRYWICDPNRCPNAGRPRPHSPHVSLYPTDYC